MRILNISTCSVNEVKGAKDAARTGDANMALTAPAMLPASATCLTLKSGYGETSRLLAPYAMNSKELTAAIPSNGESWLSAQASPTREPTDHPWLSVEQ